MGFTISPASNPAARFNRRNAGMKTLVWKMDFIYTGIRVRDLDRSVQFYTKTMDMREVRRGKMEAGGIWVELISKGSPHPLELNYYPPGSKYHEKYVTGSELDHLAFACDDVRESYNKALAGGATSAVEPWDEGGSTLAFVTDPDGVWIELHSRT
jgi:lactoylglutathione lyase